MVFSKRLILALSIVYVMAGSTLRAQNLQYSDSRLIHLGFSLGLNTMYFGVKQSDAVINGESYNVGMTSLQPGFSVGMVTDLRLSDYFNLRLVPTLHFGERTLDYISKSASGTPKLSQTSVTSIPVCVPLLIKYSALRKDNFRPYLLWGLGAYYDLGRNNANPIALNTFDYYTEFGVGCDFYFNYFKLSPELKLAVGLNDVLMPLDKRNVDALSQSDKMFTLALTKLTSRFISLTFNFE